MRQIWNWTTLPTSIQRGLQHSTIATLGPFSEWLLRQIVSRRRYQDDADLGHVFGDPVIGRLKDGKWVAIFGNGHGSTNDDSVLLIVDLASGELNKVRAGAATGGLSSPSFVYARDDDGYIYVDAIYAGDLSGNLWKFNLKNNGSGADGVAVVEFRIADLICAAEAPGLRAAYRATAPVTCGVAIEVPL